jgi:hypothetical protein
MRQNYFPCANRDHFTIYACQRCVILIIMTKLRVRKGETLFEDEEDTVAIYHLERSEGEQMPWTAVLELHLEGGRAWGDEIDQLYHSSTGPEWIIHISGFGYWGDSEYYRSLDDGLTWQPHSIKHDPAPPQYQKVSLEKAEE